MSKKSSRKATVYANNLIRFRILLREISEAESLIKLTGDKSRFRDPYIHLGLVKTALGMEPHITYERPTDVQSKHRCLGPMSREQILNMTLMIFSTPESRPPKVTSVENKEEMEKARLWLRRTLRKIVHKPKHRRIKVFREGPAKDLISKLLNESLSGEITINLDEAKKLSKKDWTESDFLESRFEDEVKPAGLEIGFLENLTCVLFLSPGKPVVELHLRTLMRWIRSLDKLPGVREFLAEAQRRIVPR